MLAHAKPVQLELHEYPAQQTTTTKPNGSAMSVLYKDAMQSVMSWLPPADLHRSFSVSVSWKSTARTERCVRVAREAAIQRRIQHDVVHFSDLTALLTDDSSTLEGITRFRHIISMNDPPMAKVIALVPQFVQLMQHNDVNIQFEAAWCITNIASTEYADVLKHGAVPVLVKLLQSTAYKVQEQAAWALSNIIADGPVGRDAVLAAGAMGRMIVLCSRESQPRLTMLRTVVWAFSNFAQIKPVVDFAILRPIIPTVTRLMHMEDDAVLIDGAWTIAHLTNTQAGMSAIVDSGVVPRLVRLLSHASEKVQLPAMRACGNLVSGNETETQAVIDAGAIPACGQMLTHASSAWTLSNIAAGTRAQIQSVLDCASILPRLVDMLKHDEFWIRCEVTYVLTNAAVHGSETQITQLEEAGTTLALANALSFENANVVLHALIGIELLLRHSASRNPPPDDGVCLHLASDHWDTLCDLRHHADDEVAAKATEIISTWFTQE